MNLFFLADIITLLLLITVIVFFASFKSYEDKKYSGFFNALLFGMFFLAVYFLLSVAGFLISYYGFDSRYVVYSANLVVVPLASVFFFVSVLLRSD